MGGVSDIDPNHPNPLIHHCARWTVAVTALYLAAKEVVEMVGERPSDPPDDASEEEVCAWLESLTPFDQARMTVSAKYLLHCAHVQLREAIADIHDCANYREAILAHCPQVLIDWMDAKAREALRLDTDVGIRGHDLPSGV